MIGASLVTHPPATRRDDPMTEPPAPSPQPPVLQPLKPGYQTTELAVIVATEIGLVFSSAADWLPPKYAALGAAIAASAYAFARGLAKINPPKSSA
jgi:hypothetical protein